MDPSWSEKVVEALLFLRPEGISREELAKVAEIAEEDLEKIIEKLKKKFSGGIKLVEENGVLFFTVDREVAKELGLLAVFPLKKAELKTLGLIILKPGISKAEVARVRGNNAYEHIKRLKSLKLVVEKRSSGVTFLYPSKMLREVLKYANIGVKVTAADSSSKELRA